MDGRLEKDINSFHEQIPRQYGGGFVRKNIGEISVPSGNGCPIDAVDGLFEDGVEFGVALADA